MMVDSVPPAPQGQPYKFFGRQYSGPENHSNLVQIQTAYQRPVNPYHVNYNIYKQVHHTPNTSMPQTQVPLPGSGVGRGIDQPRPRHSFNNESQRLHHVHSGTGSDHMNHQDIEARKIRRNLMRRTVDYNASILQTIKNRIWRKTPGMCATVQPDVLYYNEIVQPKATMENPINCVTTRFVRTSTNKIRTPLFSVAWTPEGRRLVTGASSGEFTLWNGLTFNFETILQAHDSAVRAMEWSHNSTWLLSGDHQGIIKYWQSNMNNVKLFQAHHDPIRGLSFSPTDNKFATCGDDSLVKIWDFHRCYEEKVLRGHGADVKCVDWHPTKGLLVSGSKDSQQPLKLWDPRNGTSLATIHLHKSTVMDIEWNENGNWLLTGSRDHLVKVFDIRAMKEIKTFRGHRKEATAVSWHPIHENLFVSAGSDGCLKFWTLECEKELGAVNNAHEGMIWTAKWHPLGHVLVTGSNDHTSKFWTRNRPGDKMRDKYNLNTLPFGIEDDYDVEIAEAPETAVALVQPAAIDDSLPGLDSKPTTSSTVDASETDTTGIPGMGTTEDRKIFQSPSKVLAQLQGAIKQSGFKLPGLENQDSSLRADAPAFEPSTDVDEDFYINMAREIEEEEGQDEDGIPLDLLLIGENGKAKPKGRGDSRRRKQQKNTGKGLLPTPGEESKPKSLMDGDIEPPPFYSETDEEQHLSQSETQSEWRGNSEYNNRPSRKNLRRGEDGMNGPSIQRSNRRAFPRNNKNRSDDRHSADDPGQRHDDGLEDQWHNNRQKPPVRPPRNPSEDDRAFHSHGPEGPRVQDDTFGPPPSRGPNMQHDDNQLQQGGGPIWPIDQNQFPPQGTGGPDQYIEDEIEPPPPPPPPQSFDGGIGPTQRSQGPASFGPAVDGTMPDFTDDDCWANDNFSSRGAMGPMGRGRGRGRGTRNDHRYRDDRNYQSGGRHERPEELTWRNRRDRMQNEQRDPGIDHEPNPESGPPDWPPPPPPEWNEDEPPPKRQASGDAERRPNQGRDFSQGIDSGVRDNIGGRGGRGGRGGQRMRPKTKRGR